MAISLTCTGVRRVNGRLYVRWSDKSEQEFRSLEHAKEVVAQFDRDEIRDFLRAIAVAKFLKARPDGTNAAALQGKSITLDLSLANNLVRIA